MSRAVLLGAACAAGFAFASCAVENAGAGEEDRKIGSLSMNLEVADGIDLDAVDYELSSSGHPVLRGTLPVQGNPPRVQGVIRGVPAGDVELDLHGIARNGVLCEGKASGHVVRGRLALIAIVLHCLLRKHHGDLDVNGQFNVCPDAELATCSPTRTSVGEPVALSAKGSDPDGDAVVISWRASSGTFSSATGTSTQYTCTRPGTHTLSFTVDDGRGCKDKHEFTLFCAKPSSTAARCGNAKLETGEECDDGNKTSGDGCAPDCTEEPVDDSVLCGPDTSGFIPECACDRCRAQIDAAENVPGVAAGGPALGTSKAALAVALISCTQESGCRGAECLCGTDPICPNPGGSALGPCADEYLAAAETTDPQTAFGSRNNLAFAIGFATAVETCTIAECDAQCP